MMQKTAILQLACLLLFSISWAASARPHYNGRVNEFVQCLLQKSDNTTAISEVTFTPKNPSYLQILNSKKQNHRFKTPETPNPHVIVSPRHESQIQTAIHCSKKHGLQMRVRSGGHDYEGVSSVSELPFFILDMFNFRSISIDVQSRTAWVGAGVTLGQLYYTIHQSNGSLYFPGGSCPTVAVGGHVSGGGYGPFARKYGLAADNVIDARVIDANGRILDRESMGEDFFWAIRGGTGGSFGVILSYRVNLVEIRPKLTAFNVTRIVEQNATELVHRWQYVAPRMPKDLSISVGLTVIKSNQTGNNTVQASFFSLFQGEVETLLSLMEKHFPELGVSKEDCIEISWLENYAYQYGVPLEATPDLLLTKISPDLYSNPYYKGKSDIFQEPIPESGLREIWDLFSQRNPGEASMQWTPFGGIMDEIPESQIPFPYRAGNLFLTIETTAWNSTSKTVARESINWSRELHRIMGKYAANNPRAAYAGYRDLDLGTNNPEGHTSLERARVWGVQYFKNNFFRLVHVKTMVDPKNFFSFEQSIPTYQ